MTRLSAVGVLLIGCVACTDPASAPVMAPTALPPTVATAPGVPPASSIANSISGSIYRRSMEGVRPLSGFMINAWVQTETLGYSYWWANGMLVSDDKGHYRLSPLPTGATVYLQVLHEGCAAPPIVIAGAHVFDIYLLEALRTSPPPPTPGFRTVTGTVYDASSDVRRTARGAHVQYEVREFHLAWSATDDAGRFLLCGLPDDRPVTLSAWLSPTRYSYRTIPPGAEDTEVDFLVP